MEIYIYSVFNLATQSTHKKTMAPNSRCLIFIWILSLTTSSAVTPDTVNPTQAPMPENPASTASDERHSAAAAAATLNRVSEPSSRNTMVAVVATGANPTVPVMEQNKSTTSMPTTQPRSSGAKPFLAATTSTSSTHSDQISSSSPGVTPNATSVTLTESGNLTAMATSPPMRGGTTQRREDANTFLATTQNPTNASTTRAQTTNLVSNAPPSPTSVNNRSASALPGTVGIATTRISSDRTPATAVRPTTRPAVTEKVPPPPPPTRPAVTKKVPPPPPRPAVTKKVPPPPPPPRNKSKGTPVHGKVVAGLIGGALLVMLLGFLIIYLKKQKLNKQQVTTSEWAGPSPFLEDGVTNGDVTLRSSNRISLSSFLPQRLSKRLSLIQESNEELQEIVPGTFAGKNQEGGGKQEKANNVTENNGTPKIVEEQTKLTDAPEMNGKTPSETSQQTNISEIA